MKVGDGVARSDVSPNVSCFPIRSRPATKPSSRRRRIAPRIEPKTEFRRGLLKPIRRSSRRSWLGRATRRLPKFLPQRQKLPSAIPRSASQSANFNAGATVSRGAGAYIDIGRSIEYRSAANKEISRYIQQKLSEAVNAGALTPEQAQRAHDKIMARNPNGFQSSPPILQKKLETEIHQEVSDAAIANATKAGPPDAGRKVLSELLGTACQSQNEANVTLGRKAISRISHDWLLKTAPEVIESTLDVSDYWEYRRLLELLSLSAPELLPVYIQRGLASGDTDVREAAEDFS